MAKTITDKEKIEAPTDEQYRKAEIANAFCFAPSQYPCAHCGWPVVRGYCCNKCGSATPDS